MGIFAENLAVIEYVLVNLKSLPKL